MKSLLTICCVGLLMASATPAFSADNPPEKEVHKVLDELLSQPWYPKAPPLPKPPGQVIRVTNVRELMAAPAKLKEGGTILIADGHYDMPNSLMIHTSGSTIRGESGDRTKVVLDFGKRGLTKGVAFTRCTDVTLADLTVANVKQNGIKINSDQGVHRVRIYNVVGHNVWQRHVKGVRVPFKDGKPDYVLGCKVQYCLFYNDRPKRRGDDPYEDSHGNFGFNYLGGIDTMCSKGWVVSDNVFLNIRGKSGGARGAIFIWNDSRDCLIERNIILQCDRGICLGNGHRQLGPDGKPLLPIHDTNQLVRNNIVCGDRLDTAILAEFTQDCRILNNSVHNPDARSSRLIRVVQDNDGLLVANNLVSGQKIRIEKYTGRIKVENNLQRPVPDYFVDPLHGNLHLTAKAVDAIDKAQPNREVTDDIDQAPRGGKPDLGADEFGAKPPAKPPAQ